MAAFQANWTVSEVTRRAEGPTVVTVAKPNETYMFRGFTFETEQDFNPGDKVILTVKTVD